MTRPDSGRAGSDFRTGEQVVLSKTAVKEYLYYTVAPAGVGKSDTVQSCVEPGRDACLVILSKADVNRGTWAGGSLPGHPGRQSETDIRARGGMDVDLSSMMPLNSRETEKAESVVALGYPAVESVLPEMLEWMQDMSWPVTQVFRPFLAKIGAPLAPHIREILQTDDSLWKYWVLVMIVDASRELAAILKPDLQRLAEIPNWPEKDAPLNETARGILERHFG